MTYFIVFDAMPVILTIISLIIFICAIFLDGFVAMTIALQENITIVLLIVFLLFLVFFLVVEIGSFIAQEKERNFKFEVMLAIVHAIFDAGILFSYFYQIIFELSDVSSYESLWEQLEFILGFIVVSLFSLIPTFIIFLLFLVSSFVGAILDNVIARVLFTIFICAIKIVLIWFIIWIYSSVPADQEELLRIKDNYPHYIYLFESWKSTLR